MSFQLNEIQADLRAAKLDGWLFYDFRGRDPIAHRILDLPNAMRTRRWFYFVPAKGTPQKLVHKIETESLVTLPGETLYYSGQDELRKNVKKILGRAKNVAMQYSPKNGIPYVAMVDAGTVELVKSCGVKVLTSADLVQEYEACWTPQQLQSHLEAGRSIDRIVREAFALAAKGVREGKPLTEVALQQWILAEFEKDDITTDEGPDVAVNAHASDPHYAPSNERPTEIREGDLLLLDVWGKLRFSGSVYYDVAWVEHFVSSVKLCQQRQNFFLHGACDACFTVANINVHFAAHPELRQIDPRLNGVARSWNQMAAIVSFRSIHVHAIAVDRLADVMAGAMDKIFSVPGFFDDATRGPVHLPALRWFARSDRRLDKRHGIVSRPHNYLEYPVEFFRNLGAEIADPCDVVVNASGKS